MPGFLLCWQKKVREAVYTNRIYRHLVMRKRVEEVKTKAIIKVLFIVFAPSLWKTDSLFKAMRAHQRFSVSILLTPNMALKDENRRAEELKKLRDFFSQKEYDYVEWCNINGDSEYRKIPKEYDIIFYPQPWPGIVPRSLDFEKNRGRLMIGCEYAFHSGNQKWAYNKWYQNAAWLDFYENEAIYKLSCKKKANKGINSVITGLPIMDEFKKSKYNSPWKAQPTTCKKIIWAPHWTITEESSILPSYSNFLEIAEFMLDFARKNKGQVQFAFKPHPHLRKELYAHPEWGKDRTDNYYSAWQHESNTQLEAGEYIDLFMTSDAMIHDSSSFCCEYMMTGKPVLFMVKNEQLQVSQLNEMAKAAFYAQYLGYSTEDLHQFLEDKVMRGNDPQKRDRDDVVTRYLTPPHGRTAAENIIHAILGT